MCQPSPTIAGFLQQAEDNLALLRARAQFTPRKAREKVAEDSPGSASARMSQRLRATGSTRASPRPQEPAELELHARALRDLDRKMRGFDARFKSMEKAVASAADLAAASSRCGRDGIEAATAATAAVRVEAEAKCRELAQRIESISVPGRWAQDLEVKIDNMVQASLDHDLRSLERRLVAQFSKRHSEVLEAAEQMTSELKAEVGQQLQAFKDGRIMAACAPNRPAEALALEGRLRLAEADLQRALRDVDDWERARPAHHEQRIDKLEADLAKLFQRLGSTSDMGVQDPRARRGAPEAPSEAERPHKAAEVAGSASHVPFTERTLQPSELACDRLEERASKASGTVNVEQPAAELEVASNSGTPSAPPSPSMPSRPVVPFQPPSRRPTRPLLTVPGSGVRRMSGIHVAETPSSTSSLCEIGTEQAAPTAEASAGASRDLWEKLLAGSGISGPSGRGPGNPRDETVHQPAEDQGHSTSRQLPSAAAASFDQVSSSSPTLGSANLSDILRSTSAFAEHASGSSSHGSQTPTPRVEEDAGQVARAQSSSGSSSGGERQPRLDQRQALEALAQDVAAEPVCAFSTNVSEAEEFGSGDDLDLPM